MHNPPALTPHIASLMALSLLASCVAPQAAPAPAPTPTPAPAAPSPAPRPESERYAGDWSTAELGPGEWSRDNGAQANASRAIFGNDVLSISCTTGQIRLSRQGIIPADAAIQLRVRSSFGERVVPARYDMASRSLYFTLPASDQLWDQIIYSRGRFLVEASFQPPLLVPTRPEVARVIEDCRG